MAAGWINMSLPVLFGKENVFDQYGDPRVRDWFLMASPAPLITIIAAYFYFCTSIGPRLMKDRKPFDLKNVMIAYNFIHVVACTWLVYELFQSGWLTNYSYTCQPLDESNSPQAIRMARACWCYLLLKVVELMDTVFFVLRKKENQITFLHIYHHTHVPLLAWSVAKFWPGGHCTLAGLLNTIVHVFMYSYYLLTAMGPEYRKYVWWKKYVTMIQLVQFVIDVIHQGQIFFNGCDYAKQIPLFNVLNSSLFLYLFGSFYIRTYNTKKTSVKSGHQS